VGGSALQWSVPLPDDVTGDSFFQLDLGMRKIGPPDVTIGFEILIADVASVAAHARDC
jgi:hypothetical protein